MAAVPVRYVVLVIQHVAPVVSSSYFSMVAVGRMHRFHININVIIIIAASKQNHSRWFAVACSLCHAVYAAAAVMLATVRDLRLTTRSIFSRYRFEMVSIAMKFDKPVRTIRVVGAA